MPTQRIRIVCISDTHNQTPRLPPGDVLIHAGDLTNQGSLPELRKTAEWLEKTDFRVKIVVAGNHDVTLDSPFYKEYGRYFHNQRMEVHEECLALFQSSASIHYLNHQSKIIHLPNADGTSVRIKVFGSPYSPSRGFWAFGYAAENASKLWEDIPLDSDIVITHTPPKFHCDEASGRGAAGCEQLRESLWRVRPRLAVCGHIHDGRGVEVVSWDLHSPNIKFKEKRSDQIKDDTGATKKQFLVDLTSRSGRVLQNDGSVGDLVPLSRRDRSRGVEVDGANDIRSDLPSTSATNETRPSPTRSKPMEVTALIPAPSPPQLPFRDFEKAQRPISSPPNPHPVPSSSPQKSSQLDESHRGRRRLSTLGQGCVPPSSPTTIDTVSARSDETALSGRLGRLQTCIVNAAFMATNWPHKAGKKFNKPVVVDLDLPIYAGVDEWFAEAVIRDDDDSDNRNVDVE